MTGFCYLRFISKIGPICNQPQTELGQNLAAGFYLQLRDTIRLILFQHLHIQFWDSQVFFLLFILMLVVHVNLWLEAGCNIQKVAKPCIALHN